MRHGLLIFLSFVYVATSAQTINNNIFIGKVDSVYSTILKEQRKIWVSVPNGDTNVLSSMQRYPVVYLLDGDAHFYSVMGMIHQLSEVNGNTICPQMIVVGIPNTDRTRDLTPTHISRSPFSQDTAWLETSGGGENFTRFLEKELIPHIDSSYPTAPYRILIGHSLGGLMVVNTLINHPHLFNSYLAIDPSLWWDDQKLLKQASAVLKQKKFNGKSLFLAIANTMRTGMDTLMVKTDTATATSHIRSMLQFTSILKSNVSNGLHWTYKYYNEDDHGSVPLIAEYDGFRFIFSYYRTPSHEVLLDTTVNTDSAVVAHLKKVSEQMGYTVVPPIQFLDGLGYGLMAQKRFDKAYQFFKMNIQNYPRFWGVYDSMGDFYVAKGDKKNAIEYYNKALALNDFSFTRKKLENLKAGK